MRTNRALAALTLALALAASACSTDDLKTSGDVTVSSIEHNDADVAFATGMIPHHAQALAMADLTRGRQLDPEVDALVEDIEAAQAPEIETMVDWLTDWDEDIPATMRDHVNAGEGHGDSSDQMQGMDEMDDMPGMMSAEDMTSLEDATDEQFQDMWLTMMIEHHEGAVDMAETETTSGQFAPAVDLADDIIAAQASEIDAMEQLLF